MHRITWIALLLLAAVPALATADLGVSPATFAFFGGGYPNEPLPFILSVVNLGPDPAVNAVVRVEVPPGTTIDSIRMPLGGLVCDTEGDAVVCTADSMPVGQSFGFITVTMPASFADSIVQFRASVAADNEAGVTANEQATSVGVYRVTTVTSTADSGEGTFRALLEDVNATCREFCEIRFDLGEGAVIEPLTPLPAITNCANLRIAAASDQLNLSAPRPVELSGARLQSGSGFTFRANCDSTFSFPLVTVTGFAIDHFPTSGVDAGGLRSNVQILDSDISENTRGVLVDIEEAFAAVHNSLVTRNARDGIEVVNGLVTLSTSIIRGNRANGVNLRHGNALPIQNIITRNGRSGYTLGRGSTLAPFISDSIFANGILAIDYEEDDGPTAPVIIAAFYDSNANVTRVRGTIEVGPAPPPQLVIRVFSNSGYNASGNAEAERDETRFKEVDIDGPQAGTLGWSVTLAGDLRGRIVTATASPSSAAFFPQATSEVSEGMPVR